MQREIELYTCCGNRALTVTVDPAQLSGEAWRLARCLRTTDHRRPNNGVRVQSLQTNRELAEGKWPADRIGRTMRLYPDWANAQPLMDWRFQAFHIWPDHKQGPHPDLDPERLTLLALAYLQREAERIRAAGGTVRASGDYSVRLAPLGWDENAVLLPDEQAEARTADQWRALFGGSK